MDALTTLISNTAVQVWITFTHNWPFLVLSTAIAVALKLYMDPKKVGAFLNHHRNAGVVGATAVAVATPLCSCGTTAIILGMIAGMMPWAPIVAFMVASPLTSPEEYIYSAGLFGWPFATAFFVASIVLGLLGGLAGALFESRGWLKNQARFVPISGGSGAAETACSCANAPAACACEMEAESCDCGPSPAACACDTTLSVKATPQSRWVPFLKELWTTGKRLAVMFFGFAFIGYFLNGLIPAEWVGAIFGKGNVYSVPLAATLGLPLYINTEASLPLVRALIDGGMSQGAALAFLITGAGTSFGAVAGALTIARWRVIGLVVATLWVGAVAIGYLYNLALGAGMI